MDTMETLPAYLCCTGCSGVLDHSTVLPNVFHGKYNPVVETTQVHHTHTVPLHLLQDRKVY